MSALPWLRVGIAISIVVGLIVGDRVGRALGANRLIGSGLVIALGLIVSATLTPLRDALESGVSGEIACDFSRIGFAPLHELVAVNDTSLNVLLFVPLGIAIGLAPRSRSKYAVIALAFTLPFVVEIGQLLLSALDRACQSADIFDNLTGLLIGLVIGGTSRKLTSRLHRGINAASP